MRVARAARPHVARVASRGRDEARLQRAQHRRVERPVTVRMRTSTSKREEMHKRRDASRGGNARCALARRARAPGAALSYDLRDEVADVPPSNVWVKLKLTKRWMTECEQEAATIHGYAPGALRTRAKPA